MSLPKIISRVLGRPAAPDIEAVTSVLERRNLQSQGTVFTGFKSPPGRF